MTEPLKVYLVWQGNGDFEEDSLHDVFSTREKAQAYIDADITDYRGNGLDGLHIEEVEVS